MEIEAGSQEWEQLRRRYRIKVLLNNDEIGGYCVYANEEKGIVECFKLNSDGNPYVDPATERIATETLTGNIKIVFEPLTTQERKAMEAARFELIDANKELKAIIAAVNQRPKLDATIPPPPSPQFLIGLVTVFAILAWIGTRL